MRSFEFSLFTKGFHYAGMLRKGILEKGNPIPIWYVYDFKGR